MTGRHGQRSAGRVATGPAKMIIVDLGEPVPNLCSVRPHGGRYVEAWVLAIRDGRPLGRLVVPFEEEKLSGEELVARLAAAFTPPVSSGSAESVDDAKLPFASVVVPTLFRRTTELERCLWRLTQLDYPAYEVVVVDNRPDADRPGELPDSVRDDPRLRVVAEHRPGISAARNRGVAVADGDILAFTDDDVEVCPRWLRALGSRFVLDPDVDCAAGLVLPKELETPAQLLFEQYCSGLTAGFTPAVFRMAASPAQRRCRPFSAASYLVERQDQSAGTPAYSSIYAGYGGGNNMAFRRQALTRIGGFDETLGTGTRCCGGEDGAAIMMLLWQGGTVAYEPAAFVQHLHRRTYEQLSTQVYGYGIGFTAMLTAMIRRDPLHLVSLALDAPRGLRALVSPTSDKNAFRQADYPKELSRLELKGMLYGPLAYLRARRAQRHGNAP
jgi:Glycosyl transferase family 2